MFYELEVEGHVRIPPNLFNTDIKEAIITQLNEDYKNYVSQDLGFIIFIADVLGVGEGVIIPGDGAAYYEVKFKLITFKPELQEFVLGKISDIADFGAFINIGPADGMIHIGQTMDDYVTFSKTKVLVGKQTKHSLKVGDKCRARIVAVSYRDIDNPKIGLTMRQPALGKEEWLEEERKKVEREAKKAEKEEKKK